MASALSSSALPEGAAAYAEASYNLSRVNSVMNPETTKVIREKTTKYKGEQDIYDEILEIIPQIDIKNIYIYETIEFEIVKNNLDLSVYLHPDENILKFEMNINEILSDDIIDAYRNHKDLKNLPQLKLYQDYETSSPNGFLNRPHITFLNLNFNLLELLEKKYGNTFLYDIHIAYIQGILTNKGSNSEKLNKIYFYIKKKILMKIFIEFKKKLLKEKKISFHATGPQLYGIRNSNYKFLGLEYKAQIPDPNSPHSSIPFTHLEIEKYFMIYYMKKLI